MLEDKGDKKQVKILGICGLVYFVSIDDDFDEAGGSYYTIQELQTRYAIVQPPKPSKPIQKLSKAEIAEKLGIDVDGFEIE